MRVGVADIPTRPDRGPAAWAAVGGVGLFWIGTFVAGALAPGYSVRDDFVSSLAGRGSEVAALGVAGLVVLALAHLAAAVTLRAAVGIPLALAGVAGLVIAVFRTACPAGAAGCGFAGNDPVPDLADLTHGYAAYAYEIALVAAMVMAAGHLVRTRPLAAARTVVAAVLSVVLALLFGGVVTVLPGPSDLFRGGWERAWLVVNTGWLVLAVTRPETGSSTGAGGAAPDN